MDQKQELHSRRNIMTRSRLCVLLFYSLTGYSSLGLVHSATAHRQKKRRMSLFHSERCSTGWRTVMLRPLRLPGCRAESSSWCRVAS